jgi:hypothetical protein
MDDNTKINTNTGQTEIEKLRQEAQGRSDIARWQQDGGALSAPRGKL